MISLIVKKGQIVYKQGNINTGGRLLYLFFSWQPTVELATGELEFFFQEVNQRGVMAQW